MLNVTSKSENETFLKLHEFVSLLKLESSRNMTSKVISNRAKARKSKSTEQYDCKLFFCLDGRCNSMARGGVLPYKRLMGMCRWMGSHFQDWTDYNGVTFLVELLEWGRTFSRCLG